MKDKTTNRDQGKVNSICRNISILFLAAYYILLAACAVNMDIWAENLTGLYQTGKPVLLWSFSFMTAAGFSIFSTRILKQENIDQNKTGESNPKHTISGFSAIRKNQYQIILVNLLSWGIFFSALIPYTNTSAFNGTTILNDLHVWLSIICIGGFSLFWIQFLRPDQWCTKKTESTAKWTLLITSITICIMAAATHICGAAELFYAGAMMILLFTKMG